MLSDIPVFGGVLRSEAYRFVTLVDVCYEHRTRLLCSADAMPFELFEKVLTQVGRAGPLLALWENR